MASGAGKDLKMLQLLCVLRRPAWWAGVVAGPRRPLQEAVSGIRRRPGSPQLGEVLWASPGWRPGPMLGVLRGTGCTRSRGRSRPSCRCCRGRHSGHRRRQAEAAEHVCSPRTHVSLSRCIRCDRLCKSQFPASRSVLCPRRCAWSRLSCGRWALCPRAPVGDRGPGCRGSAADEEKWGETRSGAGGSRRGCGRERARCPFPEQRWRPRAHRPGAPGENRGSAPALRHGHL